MDFAYKLSLKNSFKQLIKAGKIDPHQVKVVHLFVDEHSSVTDGRYELKEALESEFKLETFNEEYNVFFPPLFSSLQSIDFHFCDSSRTTLVRASDVIANNICHHSIKNSVDSLASDSFFINSFPK